MWYCYKFTFESEPDKVEESNDDWEELDCDLNESHCDKFEDMFCKVGDDAILRFGVDAAVESVLADTLSQPGHPDGDESASFCFGKSFGSQK